MLARLEEDDAVRTAEVDRRGELVRLRLRSASDVSGVLELLAGLGFSADVVGDAAIEARRWYGPNDVSELSREEGRIIAERVVPPFARRAGLAAAETEGLKALVASALFTCFSATRLDASTPHDALNDACRRAVERATSGDLGPDRAAALGEDIRRDLASRSAFKA